MTTRVQDLPPFAGHSPERERPLGAYALLSGTYAVATAAFATGLRRRGHPLPDRIEARDIALIAVATHKSSRMIAKDRVGAFARAPFTEFQDDAGPGEVDEAARGRGLQRAIGELLVCPFCLAMWISSAFVAGLVVAPRATRLVATVFTSVFASDVLQLAYARAERAAAG